MKSSAFTGGAGNPLVSTVEMFAAGIIAVLALLAPALALAVVAFFCWFVLRLVRRHLRRGEPAS